jgi:AraC-like DNA-binding protein
MHASIAIPMRDRPIFHSRSVEETQHFFRASGLGFELVGCDASELEVQVNGILLPGIYLGYTEYGSPGVDLRLDPEHASYWIKLPIRGHLEATFRGDAVMCDTSHGAVLSPTREYRMRVESGGARVNLALKREALVRHLATLLGDAPGAMLDFAPELDLTQGHGHGLAGFVRLALAELERRDNVLSNPMTIRAFEEFVLTGLLLSHPHNYAEALRRLEKPVAPRDVKRAIDFMEANLDSAIGLGEIVAASGVAGRTLLKHFREFKGVSPMRYLRNARLERVRAELRGTPGASVTDIAMGWGFTHMGRFSIEYRKRFGESPSVTAGRRTLR